MEQHNCKLPYRIQTSVMNVLIEDGSFIPLRRKIAKLVTISKDHPLCLTYYRSKSSRRNQQMRHLALYFPPIIHPFSKLNLYWEIFMSLVYTTMILMATLISGGHVDSKKHYIRRVRFALDSVYILDMIKIFLTGYYDSDRRQTVLKGFKVAKRYLKSFFIIDLVCLSYCIVPMIRSFAGHNRFNENYYTELEKLSVYLRILRVTRWRHALQLLFIYLRYKSISRNVLKTTLTYTLSISLILSLTIDAKKYIDRNYQRKTMYAEQLTSYYSAIAMMCLVSAEIKLIDVALKKLITIFFMWVGFCIQGFVYVHIMKTWNKYMNVRRKKQELLQQFGEFMRYKGLPVLLRQKIYSFFSFKYKSQFYNETQINQTVSKHLREDILLYITQHHTERVHFFRILPKEVLRKVISQLKSEVYLADDVIVSAGETGNRMYFIYFGTVAIYSTNGLELCHLEDGAHFGEIALIFNEIRTTTVVAVTPCELFTLNRSDFHEALTNYPNVKANIWKIATDSILHKQGSQTLAKETTIAMRTLDKAYVTEEEDELSSVATTSQTS